MQVVLEVAFLGVGLGAMYALIALGLVLIYRGSGVLNFAQGAIAVCATYFWYELHINAEWPFAAAAGLALVVAGGAGVLIHWLVMRPLRHASPLARTVATLGLFLTLESVIVLRYGTEVTNVPSTLPSTVTRVLGIPVSVDRLLLLALASAVSVTLWAVYRFSPFGRSTTAVAENQYAAATFGLSPDFVASANWALGCALAALAGIMSAPILSLNVSSITTLMLASLAAALAAKFRSFMIVLVASLGVAVAQTELTRWVTNPGLTGLSATVPFVVIVVVIAVRGQAIPLRDFLLERLPAVGTGRMTPVRAVVATTVVVAAIATLSEAWADAFAVTFAFAAFMLSFVVIIGYTGQISLAQWSLAGVGAWVAGRLIAGMGVPLPLAALLGIAATVPVGLGLALPALRTRGVNLAVVTLGLGTALEVMIFDNNALTGGYQGTTVTPEVFGWNFGAAAHPYRFAYVALGGFVVVAIIVANVRRGVTGRRMLAVRNNERAATALGIGVRSVKMYAFGLAAAIAAVGGIIASFPVGSVDYTQFSALASVEYTALAFLGGIGFILGPIQGAVLVPGAVGSQLGDTVIAGFDRYLGLIGGVGLLVIILMNHDGVAAQIERQAKWVAGRRPGSVRRTAARAPFFSRRRQAVRAVPPRTETARRRVPPKPLKVRDLTVKYGNVVALSNVSLSVEPGRVTGLIGPNGAGKTTLLDAVTGFVRPVAGTIGLGGYDISRKPAVARARAGIGRSFQSLELFEDMTVSENIFAASDPRGWRYNLSDVARPTKSALSPELLAVVREFQLEDYLDHAATALPYGRRRLLAIARAVAGWPSVLLLDEPAAGLSGMELRELADVVRRLATEWGMAVLLIEHDMEFVLNTCDDLEVIDFGRNISGGSPECVRSDEAVIAAYLGTSDRAAAGSEVG
jgi:sulfate-transporting ATPase